MVANPTVVEVTEPRGRGRDVAAVVHTLPHRDAGEDTTWIAVVDSRPCRREFICNFLNARDRLHGRAVALDVDELTRERLAAFKAPAMIVFSVGGLSLADREVSRDFERLLGRFDGVPVVVLSDVDAKDEAQLAIVAGAHGFVPTMLDPQLLCTALALVHSGGKFAPPEQLVEWAQSSCRSNSEPKDEPADGPLLDCTELSPRQTHVLLLLQEGLANKVIAAKLGMTESTVKVHVRQIMRRLGASNRTEAALLAQRYKDMLKRKAD